MPAITFFVDEIRAEALAGEQKAQHSVLEEIEGSEAEGSERDEPADRRQEEREAGGEIGAEKSDGAEPAGSSDNRAREHPGGATDQGQCATERRIARRESHAVIRPGLPFHRAGLQSEEQRRHQGEEERIGRHREKARRRVSFRRLFDITGIIIDSLDQIAMRFQQLSAAAQQKV